MFEMRQLRYFVALAEEGNFGRAAARLGITQPALSLQLQQLEKVVGVALVNRSNRAMKLTASGVGLLDEARRLISDAESTFRRVRHLARGESGVVRVGLTASGAFGVLPPIIRAFRMRYPEVQLEFDEAGFEMPFSRLEAGLLDVAIARGPLSHPHLFVESLLTEPLFVALPVQHPLSGRKRVPLKKLANEPFIMFPRHRSPQFFDAITSACGEAGFTPSIVQQAVEWQLIASLVAAGLGITLVPSSVQEMPRKGVVFRPVMPASRSAKLVLVYEKTGLSPAAQAFVRVAQDVTRHRVESE